MNSIDIKDYLEEKYPLSVDVLRTIIESIPANVFFKDVNGRYQMASQVCDALSNGEPDWTIIGKTDMEVQLDPELGRFYYEDDLKIVRTLKGSHYISKARFDGIDYYYEITKNPLMDPNGQLMGIVGIVTDVTEFKRLQAEQYTSSITDALTGAHNRTYYEEKLAAYSENRPAHLCIIMSDANNLKQINDQFGHKAGDELLQATVQLLRNVVGTAGDVVRIGGDEFVTFCQGVSSQQCAEFVTAIKAAEPEVSVCGLPLNNAYGYAMVDAEYPDVLQAIAAAEKMMYANKRHCKCDLASKIK